MNMEMQIKMNAMQRQLGMFEDNMMDEAAQQVRDDIADLKAQIARRAGMDDVFADLKAQIASRAGMGDVFADVTEECFCL